MLVKAMRLVPGPAAALGVCPFSLPLVTPFAYRRHPSVSGSHLNTVNMTTIANTRRKFFNLNLLRQPRFLAPAKLVATSVAKLVDAPGLRESAREVRRIVAALKPDIFQAPMHINKQAQELIDRIDETIAPIFSVAEQINQEVRDPTDIGAGYLFEAQAFIDKLEKLKVKLIEVKARGYDGRFFHQQGIIRDLEGYDRLFVEARGEFSVSAANHANQVVSRASHMTPALPAVVVRSRSNIQFPGVIQLRDYIKLHRLFFLVHAVSQSPPLRPQSAHPATGAVPCDVSSMI